MDNDKRFQQNEIQQLLKKENDTIKQENRVLKDKVSALNHEVDQLMKQRQNPQKAQVLESEINHLRQQLNDKEREYTK